MLYAWLKCTIIRALYCCFIIDEGSASCSEPGTALKDFIHNNNMH